MLKRFDSKQEDNQKQSSDTSSHHYVIGSGLQSIIYKRNNLNLPLLQHKAIRFSHPFFHENENEIVKVTSHRCALQALAIKQHIDSCCNGPYHWNPFFLFPDNETLPLSELDAPIQNEIRGHFAISKAGIIRKTGVKPVFDRMVLIRMEDGGVPWTQYPWTQYSFSPKEEGLKAKAKDTQRMKLSLIQAVLELHRHHVTHNDIQARNILIKDSSKGSTLSNKDSSKGSTFLVRLIDWEFAVIHTPESMKAEEMLFNNLGPFSFLRFLEVWDHSLHTYKEQIQFDWKRVFGIIESYNGIDWETVKSLTTGCITDETIRKLVLGLPK